MDDYDNVECPICHNLTARYQMEIDENDYYSLADNMDYDVRPSFGGGLYCNHCHRFVTYQETTRDSAGDQ